MGLPKLERVKKKIYGRCGKTLLCKIRKACQVAGLFVFLKGNFEVCVLVVDGDFFDFGIFYVTGKGVLYFPDTVVNICNGALGKHLDSAIDTVADKSG